METTVATTHVLTHWYGVCERAATGMFAEPLNVLSSFAFMVVAVLIYRFYHRHEDLERKWIWDIHALTFTTFIIGVNSVIFHMFPTPITELMDTSAIILFIGIYFTSVLFRIARVKPFGAFICMLAFTGTSYALVHQFPHSMNDSIGYLSSMIALIVIAVHLHLRRRPSAQYFMLASITGMVSLFCRVIDKEICTDVHIGTHFVWHLLNATLLYILMRQIIRNVNREARLKRLAGDSSAI